MLYKRPMHNSKGQGSPDDNDGCEISILTASVYWLAGLRPLFLPFLSLGFLSSLILSVSCFDNSSLFWELQSALGLPSFLLARFSELTPKILLNLRIVILASVSFSCSHKQKCRIPINIV